jgi:hypothetical protein
MKTILSFSIIFIISLSLVSIYGKNRILFFSYMFSTSYFVMILYNYIGINKYIGFFLPPILFSVVCFLSIVERNNTKKSKWFILLKYGIRKMVGVKKINRHPYFLCFLLTNTAISFIFLETIVLLFHFNSIDFLTITNNFLSESNYFQKIFVFFVLIFESFIFFKLREQFRLFYAVPEFIFGVSILYVSIFHSIHVDNAGAQQLIIACLSSLYIMVRGIDNFNKFVTDCLSKKNKFRSLWDEYFR